MQEIISAVIHTAKPMPANAELILHLVQLRRGLLTYAAFLFLISRNQPTARTRSGLQSRSTLKGYLQDDKNEHTSHDSFGVRWHTSADSEQDVPKTLWLHRY